MAHIPSVAALESDDEQRLGAELRLVRLREQLAVIRALADQLEHFGPADAEGLGEQLVEETTRAESLVLQPRTGSPGSGDSGVFVRRSDGETSRRRVAGTRS